MTIEELEEFFSTHPVPRQLRLNDAEFISDIPKFLESHFMIAKSRSDVPTFNKFHDRLIKVKDLILKMEEDEKK